MSKKEVEFEFVELMRYALPQNMTSKVQRMVNEAIAQFGRGSRIRAEVYVAEHYGEWYDYLEEESP